MTYDNLSKESSIDRRMCIIHYFLSTIRTGVNIFGEGYITLVLISVKEVLTMKEMKEYHKAYYQEHKQEYKEYHKAYYQEHKDEVKEYVKAWKDAHKANVKAWNEEHKDELNEYMKAYLKSDVNSLGQTKHSIRKKSQRILEQMNLKIPNYQIHHCFGYEDPSKFIYISKSLHHKIHQFLRDNDIDADKDHWMAIRDLVNSTDEFWYIKD